MTTDPLAALAVLIVAVRALPVGTHAHTAALAHVVASVGWFGIAVTVDLLQ